MFSRIDPAKKTAFHDLRGAVVGGLFVGGCVVGVVGLAEAGTMEQLPLLNLKSSTAISPV
jgi:hypothetical protein